MSHLSDIMRRAHWSRTRKDVLDLIEALRPEAIRHVGPVMLEEMAAYHTSPKFFRRRRAECLASAIAFKLIGMEMGRDHSRSILACLSDCRKWRTMEKPSQAKPATISKFERAA